MEKPDTSEEPAATPTQHGEERQQVASVLGDAGRDSRTSDGSRASAPPSVRSRRDARIGVAYGIAAFTVWGLITIYFKQVERVPAPEVVAHRVVFSMLLIWAILLIKRRVRLAGSVLRNGRTLLILCASTCLIACNWLVFIWAVGHERIIESSLGYFINPLFNVLLGYVFLRERLRPMQRMSVVLALTGVVVLAVRFHHVPAVSLILPISFGLYALLRKIAHVDGMIGLAVETTILAPLALAYLLVLAAHGTGSFGTVSRRLDLLLMALGVVTATPLIWFLNAARRLRLSTVGFLQYISPSVQLLLAVWLYREPFTLTHLISFGLVWTGLAVYATDAVGARDEA